MAFRLAAPTQEKAPIQHSYIVIRDQTQVVGTIAQMVWSAHSSEPSFVGFISYEKKSRMVAKTHTLIDCLRAVEAAWNAGTWT